MARPRGGEVPGHGSPGSVAVDHLVDCASRALVLSTRRAEEVRWYDVPLCRRALRRGDARKAGGESWERSHRRRSRRHRRLWGVIRIVLRGGKAVKCRCAIALHPLSARPMCGAPLGRPPLDEVARLTGTRGGRASGQAPWLPWSSREQPGRRRESVEVTADSEPVMFC